METSELVDLGLSVEAGGEREEEGAADEGSGAASPAADTPTLTADQLARLRAVIVAAYPEAVPELISGGDVDALLASVETARAAYARVKDSASQASLAAIPRGGGTRALDPAAYADLSPEGKIAFALSVR